MTFKIYDDEISEWGDIVNKPYLRNNLQEYVEELDSTLAKEEFVYQNLTAGTSVTVNFTPNFTGKFIDLVFINTVKLLPSEYVIAERVSGDPTQGYTLTVNRNITSSTLINLVIIHGISVGGTGGGGNTFELSTVVNDSNDTAITPLAVRTYVEQQIENIQSTLRSNQARTTVLANATKVPINVTGFNPNDYILMLFGNTTKLFEDSYNIVTSATSVSGYDIEFKEPYLGIENTVFEVVTIYGKSASIGQGTGNESPSIYHGSVAPENKSLIWVVD